MKSSEYQNRSKNMHAGGNVYDDKGGSFEAVSRDVHHTTPSLGKTRLSQQPEGTKGYDERLSGEYFSGGLSEDLLRTREVQGSKKRPSFASDQASSGDDSEKSALPYGRLARWDSGLAGTSQDGGSGSESSWKSSNSSGVVRYANERLRSAGLHQPPALESVSLGDQYRSSQGYSDHNIDLSMALRGQVSSNQLYLEDNELEPHRQVSWNPTIANSNLEELEPYELGDSYEEDIKTEGQVAQSEVSKKLTKVVKSEKSPSETIDLMDRHDALSKEALSKNYNHCPGSPSKDKPSDNSQNADQTQMEAVVPYPDLFNTVKPQASQRNFDFETSGGDIMYEEDLSLSALRNPLDAIDDTLQEPNQHYRTIAVESNKMCSLESSLPVNAGSSLKVSELQHESKCGSLSPNSKKKYQQGTQASNEYESSNCDVSSLPYASVRTQQNNSTPQQRTPPYSFEKDPKEQILAMSFVAEHRIFLKAVLELFSQQDNYSGVGVDMNDPNTLKSGPLKKASHLMGGIWKIKYVEIRRGLLSYYEDTVSVSKDSSHDVELCRKNIRLQASLCKCRAVKVQYRGALSASPSGAVFELAVEGRPRKLWMANSKEERTAWITAINDAMVGGSVIRGDSQIDYHGGKKKKGIHSRSPYKRDLELYQMVQGAIGNAENQEIYVGALSGLGVQSLNVPVRWIMEQDDKSSENPETSFFEADTSVGVNQLWKDLLRDSVRINGELFKGDGGHGPERIVGALTRTLMAVDRSFGQNKDSNGSNTANLINESKALSFARDILLAGNRTRTGGDSYYCVDRLCRSELAVLVPSKLEAEPLNITVEYTKPETEKAGRRGSYNSIHDRSGWLKTRSRLNTNSLQKPWKKRYFVHSEGSLSYYQKASPRPHGLSGQLILSNATIHLSEENTTTRRGIQKCCIISITMKDGSKDRQLCFEDRDKFFLWAHDLENAIGKNNKGAASPSNSVLSKFRLRPLRDELNDPNRPDLHENNHTLKEHAASLGLDEKALASRATSVVNNARGRATVKVGIQACTEYNICTVNPQGDEIEDTWATVRAKFLQSFRLSGGPNARIIR